MGTRFEQIRTLDRPSRRNLLRFVPFALVLAAVFISGSPDPASAVGVPVVIDGFGNTTLTASPFTRAVTPLPLPHTSTTPQGTFSAGDGIATMTMDGSGNGESGSTLTYTPTNGGSVDLTGGGTDNQFFVDFADIDQVPFPGQFVDGVEVYMTAEDANGHQGIAPSDSVGNVFAFNAAFPFSGFKCGISACTPADLDFTHITSIAFTFEYPGSGSGGGSLTVELNELWATPPGGAPPSAPSPTVTAPATAGGVSTTVVDFSVAFSDDQGPAAVTYDPPSDIGVRAQDLTVSGSAFGAATPIVSVSGGPSTYAVGVSGMTQTGGITVDVPAGVVDDAWTQLNYASSDDPTVAFTYGVPPDFSSANSTSFTIGSPGSFTVDAMGGDPSPVPTPTLSIKSGALPAGLTFTDNANGTASIAGTPASGTGGITDLTLEATNSVGTVDQSFTLTVDEEDQAALAITSTGGFVGRALTLTTSGGSGGGDVSYAVTGTGTATDCSITSGALSVTGAGTCLVTATKDADATYASATSPQATITFVPDPTDDYSYAAGVGTGSPPASGSGLDGSTITLAANTFSDPGYTFTGWNDGSATYPAGATYTLLSDGAPIVLTAQWSVDIDAYSYAAGAGSGTAPTGGSGPNGSNIALAANTFSDPGYTFADWSDGSATYAAAVTYTLSSDGSAIVFTAQWTENPSDPYSFNAAGGAPTPASGSGLDGTTITLPGAPTRAGYTFADWSDGSATYATGATYTLASDGSAIVFTAQWTPNPSDPYSFDAAGGAPTPASGSGLDGTTITLPGAPTRAGYTFADWSDGSATYATGATYTLASDGSAIVFTAQWTVNPDHTVTFTDTGSGTGTMATETHNVPAALTNNSFSNPGYNFGGWSATNGGTTVAYGNGATYPFTSDATLYAIWTLIHTTSEKSTTVLSRSKSSVVYGAETAESLTATVTGKADDGAPMGTVAIYSSTTLLCSLSLSTATPDSSSASCSLSATQLTAGSYSDVFATYTPGVPSSAIVSYSYTTSSSPAGPVVTSTSVATAFTVTKDTSTVAITELPTTVAYGNESAVVFTVSVTTHYGEAVPAGEKVTVKVGTVTCTVTLNSSGKGSCKISNTALGVGSYVVSATYGGDANFNGSSATSPTKLTVNR